MIPLRLKAPDRQTIEQAIPFELYRTDEEGNEHLIKDTRQYSYGYLGPEVKDPATCDEEGNLLTEATYYDHVLADIKMNPGDVPEWPPEVQVMHPETPMHKWAGE